MTFHLKDNNNECQQDSFKIHSNIAKTICDIIDNTDLTKSAFNMGLFGNWGSGKSFIIKKIQEKLPVEKYLFLNIDVWKFIGNPLLRCILFDINKQLRDKASDIFPNGYEENNRTLESILYYEENLKNEIPLSLEEIDKKLKKHFVANKAYWLTIFGVVIALFLISVFVPKALYNSWGYWSNLVNGLLVANSNLLGFLIAMLGICIYPLKKIGEVLYHGLEIQNYKTLPNFSPEQFERIFKNIAKKISVNGKNLVIVFDNLDRCEPKYAYETLSTIKTFMDIPNCFYIVPCDDSAVKKYITNNYSIIGDEKDTFANTLGIEFFDKLFDTYIRIPILEEFDRDKFIEEQLKQISIYKELKENIKEIRQILYYGYKGSTPRQIKKFINDFSTYYLLAKNIDSNKHFLLKNIPFFAIMLVIKQKWNAVEEKLIQVPNLYNSEIIKNKDFSDYSEFIGKVSPFIPDSQPSLLPFIYLKETTNEQIVNNNLRNSELIENIDEKIYKRIKTETDNIIKSQDILYIINSAKSIYNTLIKSNDNISTSLISDLKITLGNLISEIHEINDFASFISDINDSIEFLYNSISSMNVREQNLVKNLILAYLQINQENYEENQKNIFTLMVEDSSNLFTDNDITSIFSNIKELAKITKNIQNYMQILYKNNKEHLVPKSLIDVLINSISANGIPQQTQNCFNYFSVEKLPLESRQLLSRKTNEIVVHLNNRLQYAAPEVNNLIANIISCLKLLYKGDFAEETYNTFIAVMYSLLERLRIANDVARREYAYTLLIEMIWFIDSDKKFSDELRKFISNDLTLLINKIKNVSFSYIEELYEHRESQKALLENSSIATSIYEEYVKEIPGKYIYFLRRDGDINNLKLLLDTIKKNQIQIEKIQFRDAIVQKYIEIGNVILTVEAYCLLNEYGYEITKKQKLNIKNTLIDFYKEQPANGIISIGKYKNLLSNEDFNDNILKPIIEYLYSKIKSTESIKNYGNIIQVINEFFLKDNIKRLNELIILLLDDHQDKEEYELALGFIQLMKQSNLNIDSYKEKLAERENIIEGNEKLISMYRNLFPKEIQESNAIEK